ncbi:MAG TPA: T9SS type A sorting domain-containing protein [Bacteroidales bacterium]|nr:T9SS type A sorting domain-containing protein [Bacteroidales bacterium]
MLLIVFLCKDAGAQWSTKSFIFGSINREYKVYQPADYDPLIPASLVLTLHGLANDMSYFGDRFSNIADTANMIVISPQAIADPIVGTAWNSGAGNLGYYPNPSVDDVGFINALVDTAEANYAIDPSRIYICGFSMGGFMTERMALQSNQKFAAFASMSGTIGYGITQFEPGCSLPVAHFHGTLDNTVFYLLNPYGIDADSLVKFWVLNNGCNPVPEYNVLPDAVADNITIDKYAYTNGDPDSEVLFYRMNGAGHTILTLPENDFSECMEVWMFFRRHQKTIPSQVALQNIEKNIQAYPNPASDFINVILARTSEKIKVELYSIYGASVYSQQIQDTFHHISLNGNNFHNGVYLLRVSGASVNFSKHIVIQK